MNDVVKLKRQIRDYFNKNTNDMATLKGVAVLIGYKPQTDEKEKQYDYQFVSRRV